MSSHHANQKRVSSHHQPEEQLENSPNSCFPTPPDWHQVEDQIKHLNQVSSQTTQLSLDRVLALLEHNPPEAH